MSTAADTSAPSEAGWIAPQAGRSRRILTLVGGFAGAYTALHLETRLAGTPDVEVVLVSKENFVLFTPMLHEVAGSGVSVTDVFGGGRGFFHDQRNRIGDQNRAEILNEPNSDARDCIVQRRGKKCPPKTTAGRCPPSALVPLARPFAGRLFLLGQRLVPNHIPGLRPIRIFATT